MRRAVLTAVVVALGVAAAARGQDDDHAAELALTFNYDGNARIELAVVQRPGHQLNLADARDAMTDAIPEDWVNFRLRGDAPPWVLSLDRWPAPSKKPASRALDLTPLLVALHGQGIATLHLSVSVVRFGDVSCNLAERTASPWPRLVYRDRL